MTITRDQARAALKAVEAASESIAAALNAAPYQIAAPAVRDLDSLPESIAAELGLEVVGCCEGCEAIILDGDDYIHTLDGCDLCEDCKPDEAHIAKLREIQANCPKADPDCHAQGEDDHGDCLTEAEP